MMHRPSEIAPPGLHGQRRAATDVVIEDHHMVSAEGGLNDLGGFGVVALAHVRFVGEAAHPSRRAQERGAVVVEAQRPAAADVLDVHCMARETGRRLWLAEGRLVVAVNEWTLHFGDEKLDLGSYDFGLDDRGRCEDRIDSAQYATHFVLPQAGPVRVSGAATAASEGTGAGVGVAGGPLATYHQFN